MALSGLTVEIDKEPNACLLPLQGEGRDGDGSNRVIDNISFSNQTHPHPNPPLERAGT